jgi:dienelactone hydrolase
MAEILLFHHAQGQTEGFLAFADELRAAGHTVHTPDLYDGKTFAALDDGVGYAKQVGFDVIIQRGASAAESLPADIVYAGFSLGVVPAQMLTQTRPGARGALLLHACLPTSEFDSPWPDGVPVQIHAMDADECSRRTSLLPGSSSMRSKTPSCSSIQETVTCSRTAASATSMKEQQRCSRSAFSCS